MTKSSNICNTLLPKFYISKRLTCKVYLKVNSFRKTKTQGRKHSLIRIAKRKQSLNTPHNTSQFLINNQKELTKEHFNNKDINSDDDLDFIVSGSMIGKMNTAFTSEDGDSVTTWEDE